MAEEIQMAVGMSGHPQMLLAMHDVSVSASVRWNGSMPKSLFVFGCTDRACQIGDRFHRRETGSVWRLWKAVQRRPNL